MTATADPTAISTGPQSHIATFEADFAQQRQRARRTWLIGSVVFLILFYLTALMGDFFKVTQVTLPGRIARLALDYPGRPAAPNRISRKDHPRDPLGEFFCRHC